MEKEGSAKCKKRSPQEKTLIPWFMVHSGAKNSEYALMYGRVTKDGVFHTVTTNPHPAKKQGQVLHPDQDRMLSVRENARAQGFPDHFTFCGSSTDLSKTLAEKYQQAGPPWFNVIPHQSAELHPIDTKSKMISGLSYLIGTTSDKLTQVGNAVPPPLGKAIGLSIRTALA